MKDVVGEDIVPEVHAELYHSGTITCECLLNEVECAAYLVEHGEVLDRVLMGKSSFCQFGNRVTGERNRQRFFSGSDLVDNELVEFFVELVVDVEEEEVFDEQLVRFLVVIYLSGSFGIEFCDVF